MPNKDPPGSQPVDESDWSNAWQAAPRLATARHLIVRDLAARRASIEAPAVDRRQSGKYTIAASVEPIAPVDPSQLGRAVAEIEKASAALRHLEPALELWQPGSETHGETRSYLSVWILIGGIWISTILVLSAATGAILYVLG